MRKWTRCAMALVLSMTLTFSPPAGAAFFGGDIVILAQILSNALQQLVQLRAILTSGTDTLGLLRDVNRGIQDAMNMMKTYNTTLDPGILGNLQSVDQVLQSLQSIYGAIPRTPEARMQNFNDQSIAEAITLHNEAFQYAKEIDPEAQRIKDYARNVSPGGAAKLSAQSLGVLIHVTNQVLRTNAAMLKLLAEDLALKNKKEKLNSDHFRVQYEGISQGFSSVKPAYDLPSLSNGGLPLK